MRGLTGLVIAILAGLMVNGLNARARDLPYEWEAASLHKYELADIKAAFDNASPGARAGWTFEFAHYGGPEGLAMLCDLLSDDSAEVRFAAAEKLVGLAKWPSTHAPMLGPLVQAVRKEQDPWALRRILEACQRIAASGYREDEIAGAVAERLGICTRPELQVLLVEAVCKLGPVASSALPRIDELCESDRLEVNLRAHAAHVVITGRADGHLGPIERALRSEEPDEIGDGLNAALLLGRNGDPLVPQVVSMLQEHEAFPGAALVLRAVGRAGEEGVQHLGAIARDSGTDDWERGFAAATLGYLHADASIALPVLLELLADEDFPSQSTAAWAVGVLGLGTPEAIDALSRAVENGDPDLRREAVAALGALAEPSIPLPDVVLGATRDDSQRVRQAALRAMNAYPTGQEWERVRVLTRALWWDDHAAVQLALEGLEAMGPRAAGAEAEIELLMRTCRERVKVATVPSDGDLEIVQWAGEALEAIRGPAGTAEGQ